MNHAIRNILIVLGILALVGGGCLIRDEATSNEAAFNECNAPLNRDRNVPLAEEYRFTGVMGAVFTAIDCGGERTQEVYEYLELNQINKDLFVGIRPSEREEVFQSLEAMGFACEKLSNSQGSFYRTGGCEMAQGESVTTKELLSLHGLRPDLSYSYFILPSSPDLKSNFEFEHQILKTDPICNVQPEETEIGSVEYAVADVYEAKLNKIGEVFTQYQCGNAPFSEQDATFDWGSKMKLNSAPSEELKTALQDAGFTCDNQLQNHSECTEWTLIPMVPIEYLFPLERHLNEIDGESCFHCG